MSADLDRQVEDLIAAADLDGADADDLRAAMAEVKARKDARLRGEVQRTVGSTHLSLREGMDRIIGLQVDTRGLVADAIKQLETQGAVLDAARVEFHDRLNAVGESLSEFRLEFAAVSDDVAAMKEEMIRYGTRLLHLEAGQAALHGQQEQQARQIRDLTQQITALRQRDAERPSPEEQARRIAQIEAQEHRLKEIEEAQRAGR